MSKHFKVNIKTVDLARDQGKKDILTLLDVYNYKLQDTAKVSQMGKDGTQTLMKLKQKHLFLLFE
jgi:hypothetical protein